MLKKLSLLVGVLTLITLLGAVAVSTAYAQPTTPQTSGPTIKTFGRMGLWSGLARGGWISSFDAMAEALKLTPVQLFEQLHSGKTLAEIAQAQGVELQAVMDAVKAAQAQSMKDRINQAVQDGKMTQDQADWLLKGLEQGYMGGKMRGFGFGHGMRGFGDRLPKAPGTPAPSGTAG
jgi:hypothetical protein